jgi:hypothetical protein
MEITQKHKDRMANMVFGKVYPLYVIKVEKKGRTKDELNQVITWLTGFSEEDIQKMADGEITFKEFFEKASIHENAKLITGVICGYRIEEIEDELVRNVRYLDKLVDELSKGRSMDKILRK